MTTADESIARLANLTPIEYDREREDAAKVLGIRVSTLDKEIAAERGGLDSEKSDEVVEEITPWPDPVDGEDLFNDISETIDRHLILPHGASAAITLWVVGSYCMDAWRIWPKLLITSPEKRCGKTRLCEVLEGLVYRGLLTSNITPSAIFRCIEEWRPCLIIDEADTYVKDNQELNGIINAGHAKRSGVVRSEKEGDGFKPKKFSVWCPQVVAGIGEQRGTLHDRSIHIEMRRKMPGESVSKLAARYYEDSVDIRRRCLRWALDSISALRYSNPNVPTCGNDRAQDNWLPIFVIAIHGGSDWVERALSSYIRNYSPPAAPRTPALLTA